MVLMEWKGKTTGCRRLQLLAGQRHVLAGATNVPSAPGELIDLTSFLKKTTRRAGRMRVAWANADRSSFENQA
jgi:hypothetical protein